MRKMLVIVGLFILLGMLLVVGVWVSRSHHADTSHTSITASLEPWQDHEQKLALIKAKPIGELTDAEKLSLISWLNDDIDAAQRHFAATGEGLGEGYGEYVIDLSLTVAGLRDKRALPALVKVMDISNGISQAIAEFGDDAVGPVTAQLNNSIERSSAVETLGFLLKGQQLHKNSLSSESADQIEKQLLALTTDSSGQVRMLAVRGLAFAKPSPEAVNALKQISFEDPYQRVRKTDGESQTVYPVREAATATLKVWNQ
jgi:hypothetical protein